MTQRGPALPELELPEAERDQLARWIRRRKSAQDLALRSRIVVECATGASNSEVSRRQRVSLPTVRKWRGRFLEKRLDGLVDEPRPGRPALIGVDRVERVVVETLESPPKNATHWSRAKMAERSGLYLNPPESAVVLPVDEKSQVPALAWSQPAFPMMPGTPERRTHDDLRHATTSLVAALNIQDGTVISSIHRRQRAVEFKKFLIKIDKTVPEHLDVHVVCDNCSTHKHPTMTTWLEKHPRSTCTSHRRTRPGSIRSSSSALRRSHPRPAPALGS
ncbi:MAG: helix-turn-helix domain-containing protein [Propionibacterium sp.]|nr:helix-turn-helix domain-containing protein [Propionibacterium sp.]